MQEVGSNPHRTTLKDVAQVVGLSVNTVSRALNERPGVGEATRQRIKAEAERIGYVPNIHARSLVLGSRQTIAMIVTNLFNPFFAELVSEAESRAIEAGYTLLLLLSEESEDREVAAVAAALRSGVDGILAVPVSNDSHAYDGLTRAGLPLVLVSRNIAHLNADLYANDNVSGMRMTTHAVLDRGATDVVLIEEDLQISTVRDRIAGFRLALQDRGVPFDSRNIVLIPTRRSASVALPWLPWQAEDAHRVATDLFERGRRPHAFVLGNDHFALGLYAALRAQGLRVPIDVMVIGWGDQPFARYLDPPLSTVALPARQVAAHAMKRLLHKVSGSQEPPETLCIEPELIVRGSLPRELVLATGGQTP
ncbi:LacI family DNA-binding transcriptional regulator [Nakamurella lactea]|uniref:LacI family DNA-binding transcriptional regulator n=1 Tax=Nakamurella lactea TaxID=459515 RepID=UPI000412CC78|nr:LacI family DNA-binding transcriptional regulator [Nakamurella lactea]